MAEDLFYAYSPRALRDAVARLMEKDLRSLPEKAKFFAALACMQGFDALPEKVKPEELDELINLGAGTELNRGISSIKGVPAATFASDLIRGPMFPGTQIVYGQGMYFATPSIMGDSPHFPRISFIAQRYAKEGDGPGVIVRCVLKKDARTLEIDDLYQLFREDRSRSRSAGIEDVGTFAASRGFDAYYCDGAYDDTDERVWIVLNRTALIFQSNGLQIPAV